LVQVGTRFLSASSESIDALSLLQIIRVAQGELHNARQYYLNEQLQAVKTLDEDYEADKAEVCFVHCAFNLVEIR
jgi:hypothetical protein